MSLGLEKPIATVASPTVLALPLNPMSSISDSLMESLILSATPLVTRVVDAPVSASPTTTAEAVRDATSSNSFGLLGEAPSAVSAVVSCSALDLWGAGHAAGPADWQPPPLLADGSADCVPLPGAVPGEGGRGEWRVPEEGKDPPPPAT